MPTDKIVDKFLFKKQLGWNKNKLLLFNKIDMSMYSSRPWVMVLQRLGEKKNSKYLYDLGYMMGQKSVEEFGEVKKTDSKRIPKDLLEFAPVCEMLGFGLVEYVKKGNNRTIIIKKNNIIEYGLKQNKDKAMHIHFYHGAYTAVADFFENKKMKFEINKGDKDALYKLEKQK